MQIVKYNIGFKTLLQQGISEPIFYGDFVHKFKRIVGKSNFSDQFKKIVKRYIRVGWLVGFVSLRPKSTAMVIAGRSVHLTTLFPGQA